MTTLPVRIERRVGQRFPYLLPVAFRQPADGIEGVGFTQDVSSRGVFLLTDAPLVAGSEIEITLNMPSEITLGESMRVRCRGRVLRVVRPANGGSSGLAETKIGVAVRLEGYEYLAEPASSASTCARVSTLHPHEEDGKAVSR